MPLFVGQKEAEGEAPKRRKKDGRGRRFVGLSSAAAATEDEGGREGGGGRGEAFEAL